MKMHRLRLILTIFWGLLFSLSLNAQSWVDSQFKPIAFTNVSVLPMTGTDTDFAKPDGYHPIRKNPKDGPC
jgi:hypothetical protein